MNARDAILRDLGRAAARLARLEADVADARAVRDDLIRRARALPADDRPSAREVGKVARVSHVYVVRVEGGTG